MPLKGHHEALKILNQSPPPHPPLPPEGEGEGWSICELNKRRTLMQYFVSKTTPRVILIMFDREDLFLEGIEEVVKKEQIDTAAITGGIGSFQRVHLHTITTTAVQSLDKFTGTLPAPSNSQAFKALSSAEMCMPTSPSSTGTPKPLISGIWNPGVLSPTGPKLASLLSKGSGPKGILMSRATSASDSVKHIHNLIPHGEAEGQRSRAERKEVVK